MNLFLDHPGKFIEEGTFSKQQRVASFSATVRHVVTKVKHGEFFMTRYRRAAVSL